MGASIKLKKSNGEEINAELISYFQVVNKKKKYVFYTLNEVVENGLVKMYVAEVNGNDGALAQNMTDEEWASLKTIMKSMLKGNEDPNIVYLEWEA